MEHLKILIGNDTAEQGVTWANALKAAGAFAVTRKPNGLVLLQYIKDYGMPDVIIVEAKMSGMSLTAFMKELKAIADIPTVIVTADFDMPMLREEIMYSGAQVFLVKPFDPEFLVKTVFEKRLANNNLSEVKNIEESADSADEDLECLVTDIIHQIGIPAHIKGYHFLRYGIMLCVENSEMINCITKLLYPTIARKYNTTSSRVERAIRHAIELAWDRGDVDVLDSYFGYTIRSTKGKPTNSEFIALISDKLRLQLKNKKRTVNL